MSQLTIFQYVRTLPPISRTFTQPEINIRTFTQPEINSRTFTQPEINSRTFTQP